MATSATEVTPIPDFWQRDKEEKKKDSKKEKNTKTKK